MKTLCSSIGEVDAQNGTLGVCMFVENSSYNGLGVFY